jgi:hypothetical protein
MPHTSGVDSDRWGGTTTHYSLPLGLGCSGTCNIGTCIHLVQQRTWYPRPFLCKYLLFISFTFNIIICSNSNFVWNTCFLGYLDVVWVIRAGGTGRKSWTQLHVRSRQDVMDGAMSTYFLLRTGVSPSFKGDTAVRVRATRTSSMPGHFSWPP